MADKTNKKPKAASREDRGSSETGSGEPQMGAALRSVYQKTVEEAVPDEMLDLLSKLD